MRFVRRKNRLRYTSLSFLVFIFFLFSYIGSSFAHSPHDVIWGLGVSPAFKEDNTLFISVLDELKRSTDGGYRWKNLDNGLDNNYLVRFIAVSPSFSNDGTVFIGTKGDGIYRSQNKGDSWQKVNDGLDTLEIRFVGISPNFRSDETVYAVSTDGTLFRSDTAGRHWHRTGEQHISVTTLCFLPGTTGLSVIKGTENGTLYLSKDGNQGWEDMAHLVDAGAITSIAVSSNYENNGTYYVGTERKGLYKTVNGGKTFVPVDIGHPHSSKPSARYITSIFVSSGDKDHTVVVTTWDEAVFLSSDGGKTWGKYSEGILKDKQADKLKQSHFYRVEGSATFGMDRSVFVAGFAGLFKSMDGGRSWSELETRPARNIEGLALSPGYGKDDKTLTIVTYDGGAYVKKDDGESWQILNHGLRSTHLWDARYTAGSEDGRGLFAVSNVSFLKMGQRATEWQRIVIDTSAVGRFITRWFEKGSIVRRAARRVLGKPKWMYPTKIAPSPNISSDATIYLGTRREGVLRSTDRGETWSNIWKADGGYITSLVTSPNYKLDRTLLAGVVEHGIFKSTDAGNTWQAINNGISDLAQSYYYPVTLILAVSPDYEKDETVFAGTVDGLFVTRDGGRNWQRVHINALGGNAHIKAIALAPNYAEEKILLVSVKGSGLYKSNDGGRHFSENSRDLIRNNYLLRFIRFSPNYKRDRILFGASSEELFLSIDGGSQWRLVNRPVRYENKKKDNVQYKGQWKRKYSNKYSARSVSTSDQKRAQARFSFVGRGVTWIGTKSDSQGIANVYLDNDLVAKVDQYSEEEQYMVPLYTMSDLENGPHWLTIVVSADKNPRSKGYDTVIDAFDIGQ